MAQVFAIGDVVNDEERKAIAWLKEKLPDDYFIIHKNIIFFLKKFNNSNNSSRLKNQTIIKVILPYIYH